MTSKYLTNILNSPITKSAKDSFISIEELEQLKLIVEAWEEIAPEIEVYTLPSTPELSLSTTTKTIADRYIRLSIYNQEKVNTIIKALEVRECKK